MPTEVILPKVDMDMATGQISRWFVKSGAHVTKGDPLFEIETDKAAMEIDAPASGILRDITGKERVDIPVGVTVAWIYAEEETHKTGTALDAIPDVIPGAIQATPTTEKAIRIDPALPPFAPDSYELIPHDALRQTRARRLVAAKATIPHVCLTLDCALDALLALRMQLNAAMPMREDQSETSACKLSLTDMIIKAFAMALRTVPDANVSWTGDAILKHAHVDVGVAISIPGGLSTPVIRHADTKPLSTLSRERQDLANRARHHQLRPEDDQGGTTTIANLGMFGVKAFAAIIQPPHATILAVGAGAERAIVKNGTLGIATRMSVTLSADHRLIDGALGAELLASFKQMVENPQGLLV